MLNLCPQRTPQYKSAGRGKQLFLFLDPCWFSGFECRLKFLLKAETLCSLLKLRLHVESGKGVLEMYHKLWGFSTIFTFHILCTRRTAIVSEMVY